MKIIKEKRNVNLRLNDKSKSIIYSNASTQVETMREKIDNWWDDEYSFDDHTVIINGELSS